MGFSFRSMFQTANGSQGQDLAVMPAAGDAAGATDIAMNSAPAMQNFQAPPLNAASPFGTASPLFKTVPGESLHAAAVQSSPFSPQGAAPVPAPLTVGDVLPQLPPDIVRMNGLPPEQPVAVSAQVLDAALRSGQAALPIFEIYRVCPALFQTAISPQDPRMVPLPAAKLPRLIASAQQAAAGPAVPVQVAASPFQAAQSAASPFSAQSPGATALPPRRNGPPPPLADIPRDVAASLTLPGGGSQAPAFPTSPFSAAAAPSAGSPFGTLQAEPASPPPGPVTAQGGMFAAPSPAPAPAGAPPQASPFTSASFGGGAETPASPFAAFSPPAAAASTPPPVATPASPFASLFGNKAVPTGQPAPDAPARSAVPPAQPARAAPPPVSPAAAPGQMSGPNLRISLASLLRGYSVAELGFDPVMVPTWIMTSQPASVVREWTQSPAPLAELGSLIDGITDVGFRNVLNHAKRDFQVRIPQAEIQSAMTGGAPPTLPNLASLGQPAPGSGSAQVVMTTPMTPPAPQQGAPLFASSLPPEREAAPPFSMPAPGPQVPGESSGAPLFSSASPSFQPQHAPAAQAPAAPPSPFQAPTMAAFPSAPAPVSNPFAFPASAPAPAQEPARAAGSPHSPFSESPTPPPRQAPAEFQAAPPAATAPSSPPAASYSQPSAEGFSSAELMGSRATDNAASRIPPAPSIPVTNPFTGKEATHVVDVQEEEQPGEPAPPYASAPSRQAASPQAFTPRPAPKPAPASPPPPPSRSRAASSPPALGIKPHSSDPDQILLRALLCTDDDLTPQRIVEMVCTLPGIAACVCLHGDQAISHIGAHKPQAREFQKQATGLAHHLRTLAPLIGIENAETFTLTSGDRLMTFCFPDEAILGILHDAEPSLGLRDKITLIARELSRMLG